MNASGIIPPAMLVRASLEELFRGPSQAESMVIIVLSRAEAEGERR